MSRFNTIKKSRKRSHEIDEKLNVLNRELEKTKDIREIAPTMSTDGLYTPVQQSLPQDPIQVPNPDPDQSSGATTDNWTQPIGDGEDGGTAGSVPTSFPKIWDNPGYQDPTSGWYGANGEPLYDESDLGYDIPDPSETGGVAALGGVQREKAGTDPGVINGYLRRDVSVNNFVDVGNSGANINGVTFKTHPEQFRAINYWITFSFRNPWIDAYWPNNSLGLTPQYGGIVAGSEDDNPRALFTAYKYIGGARTSIFDPVGDRGSTTPGDPKGTGDPDQYQPLPFGPEAFKKLNDEADQDIAFPPAAILAAMMALGIAFKGAESAWKMYQKYKQKIDEKMKQMKADGTEIAGSLSGPRGTHGGPGTSRPPSPGAGWKWDQGANGGTGGYLPDLDFYLNRAGLQKASYEPKGNVLSENAYMALLHRDYRPNEQDYVKYGAKTPEDRKSFDAKVKKVLAYAKKRPDRLEYVMKRYPKNDPRLSMLNYKMDNMTEASDEYLETQFPTNQALFTKVKERTKKNMNLTDPKNFKPVKDPIKYVDVKNTKKLKETVTRHFNKPVKSKSMFGLSISKVKKTNQKMIEKRVKEQQIKDDEKAYINEKMSRQKSNWKDDLTEV